MNKPDDKPSNKLLWIEAALQALSNSGIDGVRIDRISKKIGLTRGSFYWHFNSRDDLLEAMLAFWHEKGTRDVISLVEQQKVNPSKRLSTLLKLSSQQVDERYGGKFAEMGIRIWSKQSPKAAETIMQIDAERIAFVNKLLIEMQLEPALASFMAELIYNAYIGMMSRDLSEEHVARTVGLAETYMQSQIRQFSRN